jgi:hypothetical protein
MPDRLPHVNPPYDNEPCAMDASTSIVGSACTACGHSTLLHPSVTNTILQYCVICEIGRDFNRLHLDMTRKMNGAIDALAREDTQVLYDNLGPSLRFQFNDHGTVWEYELLHPDFDPDPMPVTTRAVARALLAVALERLGG